MEIIWILSFFFAFVTIIFIVIAYFFPEWVGITGKKALDIQKHQQRDSEVDSNSNTDKPKHNS